MVSEQPAPGRRLNQQPAARNWGQNIWIRQENSQRRSMFCSFKFVNLHSHLLFPSQAISANWLSHVFYFLNFRKAFHHEIKRRKIQLQHVLEMLWNAKIIWGISKVEMSLPWFHFVSFCPRICHDKLSERRFSCFRSTECRQSAIILTIILGSLCWIYLYRLFTFTFCRLISLHKINKGCCCCFNPDIRCSTVKLMRTRKAF